jgi:hypothetical protein
MESLLNADYGQAEKCDEALRILRQHDRIAAFQEVKQHECEQLLHRGALLKSRRDAINTEFSEQVDRMRAASYTRYEDLYARHRQEIEHFKEKWQAPAFLRQFNRPSARLLALREVEKKMALSGMFAEAKSTKRMADDLQAKEEAAMQAEIESQMRAEFARLRERQKGEAEKMVKHDDKLLDRMEDRRQRRLDPLRAAAKRLLIPPKKAVARQSIVGTFGIIPPPPIITSPRTRNELAKFRETVGAELKAPVIDDKAFERLTAPGKTKQRLRPAKLPAAI